MYLVEALVASKAINQFVTTRIFASPKDLDMITLQWKLLSLDDRGGDSEKDIF